MCHFETITSWGSTKERNPHQKNVHLGSQAITRLATNTMQFQSFGAARTVTGSKHLLTTASGFRVLLDCGLFQGIGTSEMNQSFGFEPESIDVLVLSHAHIDHSGLLPRLVKKGFRGKIIATPATRDLAEMLLGDSARIQSSDIERINKRRKNRGEALLEPLYEPADVPVTMALFEPLNYHQPLVLSPEITVCLYDAGHLLGSASVHITCTEGGTITRFWFTGDIGRPNDKILRSPEVVPQADYILCEATYGNKLHPQEIDMKANLLKIVEETCVQNRGKLLIPAFAVDRTQEIVYALDQLANEGLLPRIPVFIDSPLSVKATLVMKNHEECFNPDILAYIKKDGDAFGFPQLHYITDVADSKAINHNNDPCIIVSSSGMAEAGRIKHHIANHIHDPACTVLLVGYCSENSLGGALKRGDKQVRIFSEMFEVKCNVEVMDAFSAHADYNEMMEFLAHQNKASVRSIFLVHGEYENQGAFRDRLLADGWPNIEIPEMAEKFIL